MNQTPQEQGEATGPRPSGSGSSVDSTGEVEHAQPLPHGRGSVRHGFPLQAAVIVAVAALIFLPWLSLSGFTMSEGHRVAPAWEMLDRGDWLVPHMFGRVYLRKPPGMPWAIALSSMAFGKTELAARFVSTLATALSGVAACWFARRWYGPRWGLSAGMALILMPVCWSPATTAEIEALHNMFTLVGALAILDLGLAGRNVGVSLGLSSASLERTRWAISMCGGVALGGMLLTKGPAGVPVLLAATVALLFTRSIWPKRLVGPLALMMLVAAALALPAFRAMKHAAALPVAVTQGVEEFLWSKQKLGEIALLPLMGLLAALPASLLLVFPWGRDAKAEALSEDDARALRAARGCTIALLASLGIYTAIGVSNPRYVMPALGLAAMVVPYALRGCSGLFGPLRQRIVLPLVLWRPKVLAAVMMLVALGAGMVLHLKRLDSSGEEVGRVFSLGILASGGDLVVADHAIEARPEVLLYASRGTSWNGKPIVARWSPLDAAHQPPVGGYFLLREDDQTDELQRLIKSGILDTFRRIGEGTVSKFKFGLYLRER